LRLEIHYYGEVRRLVGGLKSHGDERWGFAFNQGEEEPSMHPGS
jgi:hypothetical protein